MDLVSSDVLFTVVIVLTIGYAFINGFHDAGLSVGNAVASSSVHPRLALIVAAVFNFIGALLSQGVAESVAVALVEFPPVENTVLLVLTAGVFAALVWNITTYLVAVPVSSTHCLFGGIIGAALVFGVVTDAGLVFWTLIAPVFLLPVVALVIAYAASRITTRVLASHAPKPLFRHSRFANNVLSASLGLAHGVQDAQKFGVVMMIAILAHTDPAGISHDELGIDWPVRILIAVALGLGTFFSGWRMVHTVSVRMVTMGEPVKATVADAVSAGFLFVAAFLLRLPVSMSYLVIASNIGTELGTPRPHVRGRFLIPVVAVAATALFITGLLGAAAAMPLYLLH